MTARHRQLGGRAAVTLQRGAIVARDAGAPKRSARLSLPRGFAYPKHLDEGAGGDLLALSDGQGDVSTIMLVDAARLLVEAR